MLTSTPKIDTTTQCSKTSSMDKETEMSSILPPLYDLTDVENHRLCVDSSSDADTVISKYNKLNFMLSLRTLLSLCKINIKLYNIIYK